jgi:thiamine pyrophosphokinase
MLGDLDSVRANVLKFYESKKTTIIRIAEQENNDFEMHHVCFDK